MFIFAQKNRIFVKNTSMESKKRVLFPYGVSNLEKVVSENHVFVDKTPFIEKIEFSGESYTAFLRPRRFGKSLFLSLLEHYYDINRKAKFDKLFSTFYIGQHPTPLANHFRILKFDFSGIDTKTAESTYIGFLETVRLYISGFCRDLDILQEHKNDILSQSTPELIIKNLFIHYPQNAPPIYLLIDEYDHFTNEILLRSLREFKESVSQNGYVRKFYESIKTATQSGIVNRLFITGVSPITLDSLTSGFNMTTNLSLDEEFHDMMGFTESEVRDLLLLVLADKSREEKIINDMRIYYNGYKFHNNAQKLYNSDMVLYFLKFFSRKNHYPDRMLDENIAPDYGKLKMIFERLNWTENTEILETVLREGNITAQIIRVFDFEHRKLGYDEFVSFLFYLGNLTIEGENQLGTPVLKIPNRVIEELYWQYYADILQSYNNLPPYTEKVRTACEKMALGDEKPFFDLIQKALTQLSNRDFQKFDEKYIKMFIIAYAMLAEIFFVQTERETSAGGYIDLEFGIQPKNLHRPHFQYVFEFKYLKKEEEAKLKDKQDEAENQLRKYLQTDEILKNTQKLRAFTLVAVKDELFLSEIF
jgi:hypothetical protein